MNKYLRSIFIATIVLSIFSCKKDKDQVYDLVMTLNGTTVTLHKATCRLAPDSLNPAHTAFRMTAHTEDSSMAIVIDIKKSDLHFPTGEYTNGGAGYTMTLNYFEDINSVDIKNYSIANASGKPACKYTVNFVDINANFIRGSFTGNYLTNTFAASTETVEVTNGSFYALRVY